MLLNLYHVGVATANYTMLLGSGHLFSLNFFFIVFCAVIIFAILYDVVRTKYSGYFFLAYLLTWLLLFRKIENMILNGDVNRLKKKIQKFNHIYKNFMLTITIANRFSCGRSNLFILI